MGDIQFAAFVTVSYPLAAITEMAMPIKSTITIQVEPLGKVSVSFGMGISKGIPTAVADTVIIEPAKKQNKIPLAKLYPVTNFLPHIFSS